MFTGMDKIIETSAQFTRALALLNVSDAAVAAHFGVTNQCVWRWKTGKNVGGRVPRYVGLWLRDAYGCTLVRGRPQVPASLAAAS